MNTNEALQFVSKVKEFYKGWDVTDTERTAWVKRLHFYDYEKALKALEDFVFNSATNPKEPPVGKIFKESAGPYLMFEIKQEGKKTGQKYYQSTLPKEPHNIESYAEQTRVKHERLYGGNQIIIRHWELLFEPAPF
jgi:hypothetical protein